MANPKAPPGGFKVGGWYDGKQYAADGSFSAPGQFNPAVEGKSGAAPVQNAKDAAFLVSKGDTTAPSRIAQLPTSQSQVTPYLNDYQSALLSGSGPETRGVQSFDEIANELKSSGLLPSGGAPTAPSMVDTFQNLSEKKGLDAISASITDLKAQQDQIASQLQTNKTSERGKPVPLNVIEGRISQESQQAQDQFDFVGRQLARKQDEYNSALGNIKMIMDFTQTDFNNASSVYNTKFTQAISTFNLIHGIQQDQKTDVQRAMDNARANAQILVNNLKDGSLDINSLPPDQQVQLNKLEVQSGLPVGFFASIKKDPKADIIFTSTDSGVTQVGIRNPDGTVSVQSYGTRTSSGKATEAEVKQSYMSSIESNLQSVSGADSFVSPQDYQSALSDALRAGYTAEQAQIILGKYKNPSQKGYVVY